MWPIKGDTFSGEDPTVYSNWHNGNVHVSLRNVSDVAYAKNICLI